MSTAIVKQGQTITDIVLNGTGSIKNWNDVLNANPAFTEWVPPLPVNTAVEIPDTIKKEVNNVRQFSLYPLNNASVPNISDLITALFQIFVSLTTTPVYSIFDTSALSGGTIDENAGTNPVLNKGVCYSTAPAPTLSNSHTDEGTGNDPFISTMTGLLPEATYYVRAYATTAEGTFYGEQVTFETLAADFPIVKTTIAQSNYTANKGTSGNIGYILKVQNFTPTIFNYITGISGAITGQNIAADVATNGFKVYSNTTPNMAGSPVLVASYNPLGTTTDAFAFLLLTVAIPAYSIIYIIVTLDIDAAATTAHTLHLNGATNPLVLTITGAPVQNNLQSDIAALITIGV